MQSGGYIISLFVAALFSTQSGWAAAGKSVASYPAKYEGGSLPLAQHSVTARIAHHEILLRQRGRQITVPLDSIILISCATDVHRRFGASLLGAIPLTHLEKAEEYYIGITWSDTRREARGGSDAVLRLSGSTYREFLQALECATGMQAINAGKIPVVIRYPL